MKRSFLSAQEGATAIEYALIGALIFLVMVVGLTILSAKTGTHYNYIATEVNKAGD